VVVQQRAQYGEEAVRDVGLETTALFTTLFCNSQNIIDDTQCGPRNQADTPRSEGRFSLGARGRRKGRHHAVPSYGSNPTAMVMAKWKYSRVLTWRRVAGCRIVPLMERCELHLKAKA
jgi:hypothetical protein